MTSSTRPASLPATMKACVIDRFGGPGAMHTAMVPVPEVGRGEILIRVATAGIGVWDPDLTEGAFGDTGGGFPRVLGSDGAGVVVASGPEARRFHIGDRVYGWGFLNPKGGFFAEYAAIPENEAAPLPPNLSLEEAGALAVDGLTALAGIDLLQLAPGRSLMIVGASGGVGHLAVQLAWRRGARVLAVASGDDGVELVRRLGADAALDGHADDVAGQARALAPNGVDGALVLAPAPRELLHLVNAGGRIAYPNGVEPAPRGRPGVIVDAYDGYHGHDALERLDRLIAAGPFRVEVSRVYALDDVPQALRDVVRHHLGKLAVQVQGAGPEPTMGEVTTG